MKKIPKNIWKEISNQDLQDLQDKKSQFFYQIKGKLLLIKLLLNGEEYIEVYGQQEM